jgi:hypothetical protein
LATGAAAASTPALADYTRLGSVEVGHRVDSDTVWTRFGGRMEGLRLTADRSDVRCRSIRVQYGSGQWQEIFSGALREDQPVNIDLAGGTRTVKRINFVCRSQEFTGARIFISADVGRYRDEWRRHRDWRSHWSHIFRDWDNSPGPRSDADPYWVRLSLERFEGRRDHERAIGGWKAHGVDRIGLRPIDGDARCTVARARFGNGDIVDLDIGRFDRMERGRVYQLDLPGRERNIVSLDLICRAVGDYSVSVEVLVRK